MTLLINGKPCELEARTLADVVAHFNLNERIIVIEHNLDIISRELYGETPVADGDKIEIVHFVGGG